MTRFAVRRQNDLDNVTTVQAGSAREAAILGATRLGHRAHNGRRPQTATARGHLWEVRVPVGGLVGMFVVEVVA